MHIGVPEQMRGEEYRVALIPAGTKELATSRVYVAFQGGSAYGPSV